MIFSCIVVDNRKIYIEIDKKIAEKGKNVILKTDIGLEFGKIIDISNHKFYKKRLDNCTFIRIANTNDINKNNKNKIESQKAMIKCRELVKKYNLNMKLFSSYYTFDRDKLIFKFISDDRVDFRDLAKELANIYHTRIELKQVGVRDKAKEVGGCGQCGRELCCKGFLKEFNSVSINMAKDQNIALNPSKINGICGRLLCCLKYEEDCYKECLKNMPKIGKKVNVNNTNGKVISIDPLKGKYCIINDDKEIIECDINDSIK